MFCQCSGPPLAGQQYDASPKGVARDRFGKHSGDASTSVGRRSIGSTRLLFPSGFGRRVVRFLREGWGSAQQHPTRYLKQMCGWQQRWVTGENFVDDDNGVTDGCVVSHIHDGGCGSKNFSGKFCLLLLLVELTDSYSAEAPSTAHRKFETHQHSLTPASTSFEIVVIGNRSR